jgi:hypothetical protein
LFQTDRARVRSNDEFVNCFRSYQSIVGKTQEKHFSALTESNPKHTYTNAFESLSKVHYFGRFSMFIYLEMVSALTSTNMLPSDLDLRNAESCRNGLSLALDRKDLFNHFEPKSITKQDYQFLEEGLNNIEKQIQSLPIRHKNIFSIETTLCAFKKAKMGKRFVGYYIERMRTEIELMKRNVPKGVDWNVLYDFRKKNYQPKYLKELK